MERRITHTLLSLILAFTICAAPFVDAKRAEAIAPAIPAAAAAATLAAELGISVEALMTGLAAVTVAGTGVYLMNSSDGASTLSDAEWRHLWGTGSDTSNPGYTENWGTDYEKYKLGNGKSWDELTNEEKEKWDTPAQYVQSQWFAYLLANDLLEETEGGGFEPTPEPDPEQDPDGNSKWHKTRNTLTALGVGGAAVALNEAVGWLGETIGSGIHDLLFGTGTQPISGLGLTYMDRYVIDGHPVTFANIDYNGQYVDGSYTYTLTSTNWMFATYSSYWSSTPAQIIKGYGDTTPSVSLSYNSSVGAYTANVTNTATVNATGSQLAILSVGRGYYNSTADNTAAQMNLLNQSYAGGYSFPNGETFANGQYTGQYDSRTIEYNQIEDTPQELAQSVVNNNNWNNYINQVTNSPEEGKKKAVVIPTNLDNPTYDDFVKTVDDEDITPIPDDEPIVNPDPDPDPDPDPNPPDVDFENDFTHRVNELLSNPFDQLFPFCLIGDMRDFFFIIMGQPQLAQRVDTSNMLSTQSDTPVDELNGIHTLVIPLNDWGLQDVDNIEFDLDPIHDVGHFVRLIITIVLIMGIVMFSMSFFLKRGA